MIDRKNPAGGVAMYCDDCEKKFDTHHVAFMSVTSHALTSGWTIMAKGSTYTHRCPECSDNHHLGGPLRGTGE